MENRLSVLQVNKLYAPDIGGVETVVRDIAEGLKDTTDMRVLACQRKGSRVEEMYNGVSVTRAGSLGTWLSMPLSVDFFHCFRKMSRNADIIQLHAPFPLGDLAVLLFQRKAHLIIWWHSDIVRQKLFRTLLSPVICAALRKADKIIVAAEENISSSSFLPRFAEKCVVIPYGLDLDDYPAEPAYAQFLTSRMRDKSRKKLLFVGRLVYYKGVDVLIEAMRDVSNAELFIVGNGPLENSLKETVHKSAMDEKVHFLNTLPRDELLSAFYDCDVFVFPSVAKSEAFGLCQLEAMRYGKPVINANLPTAVPTVSKHGCTGITVPPGDVFALSKGILRMTDDDAIRRKFGASAAMRVREHFSKARMIQSLYAVFMDMIKREV